MPPIFTRRLLLRGLLLAGAALAGRPAAAQDVTLTGLDASVYRGFKTVDGQVYYMLKQGSSYDKFLLEIYGRDLQKKATTEVILPRSWSLQATRVVGDFTYFYFFTGKEGLLLKLDASGKQVQEVRFPGGGDNFGLAAIEPAGSGDFYLTYPIDPGKLGLVVARYGADLTAKRWQKEYLPEKGKYNLHQFVADAAHVYAVLDNTKASYEVVCLDAVTGAEVSRKELLAVGTPNLLVPSLASLDKAGHLLLAGYYGNVPKSVFSTPVKVENAVPTDGYFMLSMGPEGTPDYLSRLSFATELAGKLNTHSTIQSYTVGDYPGLKLHTLLPRPGGGYALVAETYKKFNFTNPLYTEAGGVRVGGPNGAPGPGPDRQDILDFVVLDLTAQGKLEAVRRIPKPYKLYEDHSAGPVPREFTDKLAYTYRFLYQPDPAQLPQVVFMNWHQNLLYVNTLKPATDTRDNIFTRRYLGQPAVLANRDRGELTTLSYAPTFQTPPGEFFYDVVLPHAPGKFVYAHFDPVQSSLHLQVLDVPVN